VVSVLWAATCPNWSVGEVVEYVAVLIKEFPHSLAMLFEVVSFVFLLAH
jgi:hypothetical protein